MKVIKGKRAWIGTAITTLAVVGTTLGSSSAFANTSGNGTSSNTTQSAPVIGSHAYSPRNKVLDELFHALATDLDITPKDLINELHGGQTLTQIAAAKGISQARLLFDLQTIVHTRLEKAIRDGKLTTAQESTIQLRSDNKPVNWTDSTHSFAIGHPTHSEMGGRPRAGLVTEIASLLHLSRHTAVADTRTKIASRMHPPEL